MPDGELSFLHHAGCAPRETALRLREFEAEFAVDERGKICIHITGFGDRLLLTVRLNALAALVIRGHAPTRIHKQKLARPERKNTAEIKSRKKRVGRPVALEPGVRELPVLVDPVLIAVHQRNARICREIIPDHLIGKIGEISLIVTRNDDVRLIAAAQNVILEMRIPHHRCRELIARRVVRRRDLLGKLVFIFPVPVAVNSPAQFDLALIFRVGPFCQKLFDLLFEHGSVHSRQNLLSELVFE